MPEPRKTTLKLVTTAAQPRATARPLAMRPQLARWRTRSVAWNWRRIPSGTYGSLMADQAMANSDCEPVVQPWTCGHSLSPRPERALNPVVGLMLHPSFPLYPDGSPQRSFHPSGGPG